MGCSGAALPSAVAVAAAGGTGLLSALGRPDAALWTPGSELQQAGSVQRLARCSSTRTPRWAPTSCCRRPLRGAHYSPGATALQPAFVLPGTARLLPGPRGSAWASTPLLPVAERPPSPRAACTLTRHKASLLCRLVLCQSPASLLLLHPPSARYVGPGLLFSLWLLL